MRYSRMETKKRKKSYAAGILVVIIIGVVIYFLSAGAAGDWLAQNVVAPVFSLFENKEGETQKESATQEAKDSGGAISKAITGETVNESIKINEIRLFALQAGAFSDRDNADALADNIQSRGGAGYSFEEDGLIKVVLSAYDKEENARSVKDQLALNDNMETKILNIQTGEIEFEATAKESQITALKAAFALPRNAVNTLNSLIIEQDKGNTQDVTIGIQTLIKESENIQASLDNQLGDDNSEKAIVNIKKLNDKIIDSLKSLPKNENENKIAYSSLMKQIQIEMAFDYKAFVDSLS